MDRPTGEDLFTEDNYDYIPGASFFFKVDDNNIDPSTWKPLTRLPSNPQDYLKSVMLEAQNCPDVVVAPLDVTKLKKNQKSSVVNLPKSMPHFAHSPSKQWCNQRIACFSHARQEFVRHLAQLKSIKRQTKRRPKLPIYPLPTWDDEINWRYFCLGNQLKALDSTLLRDIEFLKEKQMYCGDDDACKDMNDDVTNALAACGKSNNSEILNEQTEECADEDRIVKLSTLEEGLQPSLRILLRLDLKQIQANLEYHVEWIKTYGFSNQQGRWIYALLTCLEKPLYPTIISTLRDLARQCAYSRMQADPRSEEMNGLNLIILIVGKYFDQTDLLDPT